jgi:hypothetical protein
LAAITSAMRCSTSLLVMIVPLTLAVARRSPRSPVAEYRDVVGDGEGVDRARPSRILPVRGHRASAGEERRDTEFPESPVNLLHACIPVDRAPGAA